MITFVIPCYNEAERLDTSKIISFLSEHPEIHAVLVNDGSTDSTIDVLNEINRNCPTNSSVVDLQQNGGKAEAVRQGVLFALRHTSASHIGFMDADLSTSMEEMSRMAGFISDNDYYEAIVGSRMTRMGANIKRKFSRKVFSAVVGMMIQAVCKLPVNDTQCGAKIFSRRMAATIFANEFRSDWLFDVELFIRIRQEYGKNFAKKRVYEYPLMSWVNADGSKVGLKEIYRTPYKLAAIHLYYNVPVLAWLETLTDTAMSIEQVELAS